MADEKIKKLKYAQKIYNSGVFGVVDYDSYVTFSKFKVTDPRIPETKNILINYEQSTFIISLLILGHCFFL